MERRELVDSIIRFTCKSLCLVLPTGDYDDDDVLFPVVDWMKDRLKKKKKKAISSAQRRIRKKSSIKTKIYKVEVTETIEDKSHFSDLMKEHDEEKNYEIDPFKRTGCLFGGLANEMKNRYRQYVSDIRDGFNMHCFIAFIFIFTVCFAPALTFGGILGKFRQLTCSKNSFILFK